MRTLGEHITEKLHILGCPLASHKFEAETRANPFCGWTILPNQPEYTPIHYEVWREGRADAIYVGIHCEAGKDAALVEAFKQIKAAPGWDSIIWQRNAKRSWQLRYQFPFTNVPRQQEVQDPDLPLQIANLLKQAYDLYQADLLHLVDPGATSEMPATKHNLNTILYGPPGTGKTYSTTQGAVERANPAFTPNATIDADRHREFKAEFDRLFKAGQIDFVTFHQSYSYQDFIYGIRPKVEGTGSLEFEEKEGIFYTIADRARSNYQQAQAARAHTGPTEELLFDQALDAFMQEVSQKPGGEMKLKTGAGYSEFTVLGISSTGNALDLRLSSNRIEPLYVPNLKRFFLNDKPFKYRESYFKSLVAELRKRAEVIRASGKASASEPLKNYVLVIDEINRANISAVFGELITAIEVDKRLDGNDYFPLRLPNGDLFSVPPNLYILGTMNTADKSIALVDIALRRRFHFEAMYPRYDLPGMEDHAALLQDLNQAIVKDYKKSPDFMIGHAFFIKKPKEAQAEILNRKVVPLLMEYFPGKPDVVREILRKAGAVCAEERLEDGYQVVVQEVA